jgi:GH24 family phage-related lysozyme (muramidase)
MPQSRIRATARGKTAIAAVLSMSTLVGGVWYVAQPGSNEPMPAAVELAAESLIRPWEAEKLVAYLDRLAKPPRWTICAGDTDDVRPGMVETREGCTKRLMGKLVTRYYPALKACIAGFAEKPVSWQAMMLSLGWNIGTGAACRSTAARLGRSGQYEKSCIAATAFNKAGGRMLIGLVHRREMGDAGRIGEAELCVSGLP